MCNHPMYNQRWFNLYLNGYRCICWQLQDSYSSIGADTDDSYTLPCVKCTLTEVHKELINSENMDYKEWFEGLKNTYIQYLKNGGNKCITTHPFSFGSEKEPIYIANKILGT